MVIQHIMSAATTNRCLKENDKKLRTATQRLSTGYRINSAADNPAGLVISEKMRAQIRGLNRASDNVQDGISLLQVGDGALQEVHSILQRMRELTVQGANDTNADIDRDALQMEIDQLKNEINRISTDTEFNVIKIFKPTNVPKITGSPTDIMVYHEDYNGNVREGGIIYNGKRYAYKNMKLEYDTNDNIKAGNYPVEVYAESGEQIIIDLIFDGASRVPSGRQYNLSPDEKGIRIDNILYPWNKIKDENGAGLNPSAIKEGTYSFPHTGLTISFDIGSGMDLDSLINSLQKDGLENYELRSSNVTTQNIPVNPTISMSDVSPVTAALQDYIPGNTTSNRSYYSMHADSDGIYMYIPKSQSMTGAEITLTKMTWEQLGLSEWAEGSSVNPSGNVSGGERYTNYTYKDSITGISIGFTVDSEVSKQELIHAVNSWDIDVVTNNRMIITPVTTGGTVISEGTHSSALDSYGMQYEMGRTMSQNMTLAANEALAYDTTNDGLSFPMQDANGKSYTFSVDNISTNVESKVRSSLNNYINRYASQLAQNLNYGQSGTASSKASDKLTFISDEGYSISLNYNEDFSGWLTDNMFDKTYIPDATGKSGRWSVTFNEGKRAALNTRLQTLADNIVDSLKKTSLTIKTDAGNTEASNYIISPRSTKNKRYSSQVISGDREIKIQACSNEWQYIPIKLPSMSTGTLKIGDVDVSSHNTATTSIGKIDWALNQISEIRSGYGATQNRLEAARSTDDNTSENTQAAESLLRDADMAQECIVSAKYNILLQCGQSVLAQAHQMQENILWLLQ